MMKKVILFLGPLVVIGVILSAQIFRGLFLGVEAIHPDWEMYLVSAVLLVFDVFMIIWVIRLWRIRKKIEKIDPNQKDEKRIGFYIKDEIGKTVHSVNTLMEEFDAKSERKDNFISECYKLIPKKLYEILGITDFTDVEIGRQKVVNGTVVAVQTISRSNLSKSESMEEVFGYLKNVYSRIFHFIKESGGIIDNISETKFRAFYPEDLCDQEKALRSAISMCESINEITDQDAKGGEDNDFSVGLSYGEFILGVVGDETRISALSLPRDFGLSEFLKDSARKYNSRVLITENFKNKIENFDEKYSTRFLGCFYNVKTDTYQKIYDVFDADASNIKIQKRKSKKYFEKGVNLYINNEYKEARLNFVEVLKISRYDSAAMEYLALCNRQIEKGEASNIYLEEY